MSSGAIYVIAYAAAIASRRQLRSCWSWRAASPTQGVNQAVPFSPSSIAVAIAEDHPAVLDGLASILENQGGFKIAACARSAEEVKSLCGRPHPPQVLVIDLMLHDADGLELIKAVAALASALRIVVFSLHDEEEYAERTLRAGAHAYVMKREPVETLFAAIRTVAAGGVYFSPRISALLLGNAAGAARKPVGAYAQLTDRELQVFRLIGLACSSRSIAEKLGVSVKTIDAHREHIKNKLGVDTAPELVTRAAVWVRQGGWR